MTTTASTVALLILLAGVSLIGLLAWLIYRFLGWIGLATGCVITILLIALWIFTDNPRAHVAAVRTAFEKIPNVKILSITDPDKQDSDIITAHVKVSGKGEIGFTSLEAESFRDVHHIRIVGIGPWGFCSRARIDGSQGYSWWIDIGPKSPIPALRALGLTNVQAAISHYEDILSQIADWPIAANDWPPGWPVTDKEWSKTSNNEVRFTDAEGNDYFFCLRRTSNGSQSNPTGYSYSTREAARQTSPDPK
jgi:hypothetical protein